MIKQLSEKMRHFSIGAPKESYSYDDVMRILDDQKKGLVSYFDKEVTIELDKLASDNESLSSEKEELQKQVTEITEAKTGLETKVTELTEELRPFAEAKTKETAETLLKGKVISGAELDAFANLDLTGLETIEGEEERNAFIDNAIEGLIKTKPYLQPTQPKEEQEEQGVDTQIIAETKEGSEEPQENTQSIGWGYNG